MTWARRNFRPARQHRRISQPMDASFTPRCGDTTAAAAGAVQDTGSYLAATFIKAQITSPAKGSTLVGSATFTWTSETGATSYQVWVGSTPGTDDVAYSGSNGLSATVSGLPRDGRQLYVTLWGYWAASGRCRIQALTQPSTPK